MGMITLGAVAGARPACPVQGGEMHPGGVVAMVIPWSGESPGRSALARGGGQRHHSPTGWLCLSGRGGTP
ncbi:MAG: hypothetical protein H7836_12220 [Magnetococcus sp. YQC-3]